MAIRTRYFVVAVQLDDDEDIGIHQEIFQSSEIGPYQIEGSAEGDMVTWQMDRGPEDAAIAVIEAVEAEEKALLEEEEAELDKADEARAIERGQAPKNGRYHE